MRVFNQNKINHVFHYTTTFEKLRQILKIGFAPSYCIEEINKDKYLVPMVSFCNIPITEVDKYMRYGSYGIGMSTDWAIRNKISPVIYLHQNTPFAETARYLKDLIDINTAARKFQEEFIGKRSSSVLNDPNILSLENNSHFIGKSAKKILQFSKNWEVVYKDKKIRTILEREWRFVPENITEKDIIFSYENDFGLFSNKVKPHLPELVLPINKLEDLKYIIIKNENQRDSIISVLELKFDQNELQNQLKLGKLLILSKSQILNDF